MSSRMPKLAEPGRIVALTPKSPYASKLEGRYAQHLELLRRGECILGWKHAGLKFKLARHRCWYEIDFQVLTTESTLELHEVKGYWRDDARVKIKCAAALNPWFRFRAVQWKNKSWVYEEFS